MHTSAKVRTGAAALVASVVSAGCGGKLIAWRSATGGDDAAITDDASAAGSGATANAGSSSGGYGTPSSQLDAGASGSVGLTISVCASAIDCPAVLVCCANVDLVASCLPGPCPPSAPMQFCATAAECIVKTDTCSHLISEPEDSYLACTAPR
jgi:hypothetical protein